MGPNGKLYYTSPDGIYTYDLQTSTPNTPAPTFLDPATIILTIGIIAVAVALVYTAARYRKNKVHNVQPVS